MPISDAEKDWLRLTIRDTAFEVAEQVCKRYEHAREKAIALHQAECPLNGKLNALAAEVHEHPGNCPGRRVGRATLAVCMIILTAVVGGMIALGFDILKLHLR